MTPSDKTEGTLRIIVIFTVGIIFMSLFFLIDYTGMEKAIYVKHSWNLKDYILLVFYCLIKYLLSFAGLIMVIMNIITIIRIRSQNTQSD